MYLQKERLPRARGYTAMAHHPDDPPCASSPCAPAPPEAESAEASYCQAITFAEALGMRPLQAHCHRGLGTLYAATDQREQARTELSAAMALYRAMDMAFWLPQAETALVQVS